MLVWFWGSERAAARARGISRSTLRHWLHRERAKIYHAAWRSKNLEAIRERDRVRARERDPAAEAARQHARYYRLKDKGRCTRCGREPLLSDSHCWDCLSKKEDQRALSI
jgi:hypothetical protein